MNIYWIFIIKKYKPKFSIFRRKIDHTFTNKNCWSSHQDQKNIQTGKCPDRKKSWPQTSRPRNFWPPNSRPPNPRPHPVSNGRCQSDGPEQCQKILQPTHHTATAMGAVQQQSGAIFGKARDSYFAVEFAVSFWEWAPGGWEMKLALTSRKEILFNRF